MLKHVKKHKHTIAVAGLLMFVSGCMGAVSTTADQLGKDVAAPVVVPIREGTKAMDKLHGINDAQEQENREIEELED